MTENDTLGARIAFGGDHSPEQWTPETLDEDVRLMKQAGVNLVTLGVFSWASLQLGPDEWDFGWLDDAVEQLTRAGIAVDMATPTASTPPWLGTRDPSVLAVTKEGIRYTHGSRNHFCPSSPAYRAAAREVARRLGERYGRHPGVVMWHVGNEYGQLCWCEGCERDFRGWLMSRHGSIDELNRAWGTAFWSQRYTSFDEVQLPRITPYLVNPAQTLDHRRWASDLMLECYREQADLLRPLVHGAPITTNFMGFFEHVDYRTWAPHVDVIADDHYVDPDDPDSPLRAALVHDLMRGLGGGRPWLLMEQAMGAVNWRQHNVPKTAVQRRHDVLRAVAHGADGLLSFQWRQSRAGSERFHSAMLPNSGAQTRYHRSVREIGAELARLSTVVGTTTAARVVLLDDWQSRWAMEEASVPSRTRRYLDVLEAWYRPLWSRGVTVDIRCPADDLTGYDLVIAPALHASSDEGLARLRALVQAGTPVILGPFSLAVDENTALRPGPFPCGLTDLLEAEGQQWWPLGRDGLSVSTKHWGSGTATTWAEDLTCTGAEVLVQADHPELFAQVVRSTTHPLTYVGCDLPAHLLDALLADALERSGIAADPFARDGLEVQRRGPACFVLNPTPADVDLSLDGPHIDLLTGDELQGDVPLRAGAALVLVPNQE